MSDRQGMEIRHPIGARGELKLRNVSGRMRLVGGDGDEAVVRVTATEGAPRINVERGEGSLVVQPEIVTIGLRRDRGSDASLDFEVELPRAARLDVKTVSADVDARDLAGEQAYKTVSGDVRLAAVSGRLSARTVSGDVRLHEAGEVEVDAATTSGDLTVEAESVLRLDVRTVSGDVRVKGRLAPGQRHSVETVSGDLLLDTPSGVTIESKRALDFARKGRRPTVIGDGAATLTFRSMSGEERVRGGRDDQAPNEAPAREPIDRIEVLRALERGEIDVDEASRRLEEVSHG